MNNFKVFCIFLLILTFTEEETRCHCLRFVHFSLFHNTQNLCFVCSRHSHLSFKQFYAASFPCSSYKVKSLKHSMHKCRTVASYYYCSAESQHLCMTNYSMFCLGEFAWICSGPEYWETCALSRRGGHVVEHTLNALLCDSTTNKQGCLVVDVD